MKNLTFQINIWYLIIIVVPNGWTCYSQEKRMLTPEDYNLWHTLKMGVTSDDGQWTSFSKLYENNTDTLFFKNTITDFQYVFPSGHDEKITAKGNLFGFLKRDTLVILETLTGKQKEYPNVVKFQFTKDGNHLIYQCNSKVSSRLVLKNIKTEQIKQFKNIKEYSLNPTQKYLAIIQTKEEANSVKLISLLDPNEQFVFAQNVSSDYQNLTWNATGKSLAYYISEKGKNKYTIDFIPNVSSPLYKNCLELSKVKNIPTNVNIIKTKLYISENGDKVFFDTNTITNVSGGNTNVEIWKSSDKEIPPKSKINFQKWNVWLPIENKVYEIENDNLIVNGITDNDQKAILLDNNIYLPLYEHGDRYSDVYMMDLNTGIKKKIIQKQLRAHHHVAINPKGHHIAYFKDKNWWSYNTRTNVHKCVTEKIDGIFNKSLSDRLDDHRAYGFGGWTTTGQMIVYDQFDIWLILPDGNKNQKLTNRVNTKIRHRITTYPSKSIKSNFFGFVLAPYNLKEGLLIQTLNTEKLSEGFGIWSIKNGFQEIVHKDCKILYVKRIGKGDNFQFIESTFDTSPKIMITTIGGKKTEIAQANKQQKHFYWEKSELIHYKGPNGENLKGALFYPTNYNPDKKYPMIVSIYENMSQALNEYVPPTLENFTGFNVTNFTQGGYFVLLPDIAYTLNKPGKSALDCVTSAVHKANNNHSIDQNNIGLIGHSFGGFETTYIISQTDMFKTAVAGGAVTDLLSFYLDFDSSNLSNMERFESEQLRNKILFTESKFQSESPLMNVKTIHTPVLLWTGANDKSVPAYYSKKFFLALWRLQKNVTLLIYPDEGHVLMDTENQKDITLKTMKWFNYYLKNDPKEKWIN
ncbi:S9 family peptidase [Gelidibacter pelagius]|uniref:S9 family peptidase n=1 Tax=Gelidibacter pelagius TaxID=2819985 RepID=A0ABS3SX35_9FLAO|nr:prolyl oligopeptidase family serine peptidase [Gelidibacter pelagius]MBO3100272.1 S9 family peptidase [Gelidibacter pelagius]